MHVSFLARLLRSSFDIEVLRWALITVFVLFGYAKWFDYEVQALLPLIGNSPLLSWLYAVFGIQGGSYFLGAVEWTIALLLLAGIWAPSMTLLGAAGSCLTFLVTSTLMLSSPGVWEGAAGGFPALGDLGGFLLKDVVLLAGSLVLVKHSLQAIAARQ